MKLQNLSMKLRAQATSLANTLATSEEHFVTPKQFHDLVLTPGEQDAARTLHPRLDVRTRWSYLDVTITRERRIKFTALAVEEPLVFKNCHAADSAPLHLVERIAEWYDRRLALGYLAAAFNYYASEIINHAPTMAHALRTWPNIMLLYTRTEGVTREMIVEAQRVVPRDVVIIPQSVKLLREPATQAAVLLELMEFKEPVKREGRYRLDLPDTKHHLVRRHALGHADGLALEPL